MTDFYLAGFLDKCAAHGVDPEVLVKAARIGLSQTPPAGYYSRQQVYSPQQRAAGYAPRLHQPTMMPQTAAEQFRQRAQYQQPAAPPRQVQRPAAQPTTSQTAYPSGFVPWQGNATPQQGTQRSRSTSQSRAQDLAYHKQQLARFNASAQQRAQARAPHPTPIGPTGRPSPSSYIPDWAYGHPQDPIRQRGPAWSPSLSR
jgi:hypothetical protein